MGPQGVPGPAGTGGPRGVVAYGSVTANQSNITTVVDLTGLTATWTANPTRTYRTTAFFNMNSSVAGDASEVDLVDAAATVKQWAFVRLTGAGVSEFHTVSVVETGLSGTVTRKVQAKRVAGTGALMMVANANAPAYIVVEDFTFLAGTT